LDDLEIRPTLKFVRAGAVCIGALALVAWGALVFEKVHSVWIPAAATALLLWPLYNWAKARTIRTVLSSDRLCRESGLLGRSSQTLLLTRIQDVRVVQTLSERIFNVGSILIETAGANGQEFLVRVDSPREVADKILDRARGAY